MWISRARVRNFYSIEDSGWIDFSPKFNLVVGANNSGKSALLRALAPHLPDQPHRSPESDGKSVPRVDFDISIATSELYARLRSIGVDPIFPIKARSGGDVDRVASSINSHEPLQLQCFRTSGSIAGPRSNSSLERERSEQQAYVSFIERGGEYRYNNYSNEPENITKFVDSGAGSTFYFSPERMRLAHADFGRDERLDPDASNLARVLAFLQGERVETFQLIEKYLSEIVPGIEGLSVGPQKSGFEILTWPEKNKRDGHLAFSLADSGTGISQLVAILTAVITETQSVIIIDEINTFLHPAAIKRLLLVLRERYFRHQYIISTHSSDVISHADADKIYLVEKVGYRSNFQKLDRKSAADVRRAGAILGFSMMDVFGYDHIVWVEGETEELCFPRILLAFDKAVPRGTVFNRVYTTDPFGRERNATDVVKLYNYVQQSISPLLQGFSFGLDREVHSSNYIQSVTSKIPRLKFLPRRCLECYLVNVEAIEELMRRYGCTGPPAMVEEWISSNGGEQAYGASKSWKGNHKDRDWLAAVNAPKLIYDCIKSVSGARLEFDKVKHNPIMLDYIVVNDRESLVELKDYIAELIEISRGYSPSTS